MNATQTKTTISTHGIINWTAIDAYRPNGYWIVPMVNAVDSRGEDVTRPAYSPEVFVPSDETNCPCRFYVIVEFATGEVKNVSKLQFTEKYGFCAFEAAQEQEIEELKTGYYQIMANNEGEIDGFVKVKKEFFWRQREDIEILPGEKISMFQKLKKSIYFRQIIGNENQTVIIDDDKCTVNKIKRYIK